MLNILQGAVLATGSNIWIHDHGKIHCYESISIKDNFLSAWDLLITDTNFHHYVNNGRINKWTEPVVIEENCWCGNKVSINKGAKIPRNTVVASNSLVNKNFSDKKNIVLGGMPAHVISENGKSLGGKNIIRYDHMIHEYMSSRGLWSVSIDDIDFLNEVDIRQYINS